MDRTGEIIRLPLDWRTQVTSVNLWTADEVVELVDEWLADTPREPDESFDDFLAGQVDGALNQASEQLGFAMGRGPLSIADLPSPREYAKAVAEIALRRAYGRKAPGGE